MMNIYDCATYFNSFTRCAHNKPTYTLQNFRNNAAHGFSCSLLKYSAKVFQVFHLARDLLPVSSAKSRICGLASMHNTAPRTDVKISATHIYNHSTTASRPFTHHHCIYIPSSLFIVWCTAYVGFRMTATACSFFFTHIAIVFAVFWSHYSIHLTASGAPFPIALSFTIYREKYAI